MSSTQVGSAPSRHERAGDDAPDTPRGAKTIRRPVLYAGTRVFNPLMRTLAGSRYLPLFAVVHHRGRRSGRSYATPVAVGRTADGFVVPMTFGPTADWVQNVRAAGGCVIHWKGADYLVVEPEVIELAAARSALSPLERALVPLFRIEQFVRLRHAPARGNDPA